ncbi:MAG: hypothetical protein ACWGSQ_12490 [Longimicrobiales bacterium]
MDRILGHRDFEATQRMREFLRFVVEETLSGRSHRLKGKTIAREVFGRGRDFDPAHDPVVRVQAGRLRRVLERYFLLGGARDPVRIDIPKGGYVPVFTRQQPSRTRVSDLQEIRRPEPADALPWPTISIEPLRNLSVDPDQAFLLNGICDELAAALDRFRDLVAFPCSSALPVGEGGVESGASPREVGARFSLACGVRRDDEAAKVTMQMTDAKTGELIWSESWKVEMDAARLIRTQEDIARSAVGAIAGDYGVIAKRLFKESLSTPPDELDTYDAMLRYYHYMLVMTRSAGEDALAALQQATQRDPDYGPAWSALANLHAHAFVFDYPGIESPLRQANEYARKGVVLAPKHQLSRAVMAYVHLLRGEYDLFVTEAEAALALNPHSPNYMGTIGYLFCLSGELERGRDLIEEAMTLNPHHPRWFHHGLFVYHFQRGDYEAAYQEMERMGFRVGFWDSAAKAAVLGKLGRGEEAREAIEELLALKPDFPHRVLEILSRSTHLARFAFDFLDGLSRAGLPTGET